VGKSERAVERAVRKLRETGQLKRIGSAKSGHWEVVK
jgi:predicted HTH transcriptional regulator